MWAIVNPLTAVVMKILRDEDAFTLDDNQYPTGWLLSATSEERATLNILPVVEQLTRPSGAGISVLGQMFTVLPDRVEAAWHIAQAGAEQIASELAFLKAAKMAAVDANAEATRNQFATPGSGQAMTYLRKSLQAEKLLQDPSPSASKYPLVYIDVRVDGVTPQEAANTILAMDHAWSQIGTDIEDLRRQAKSDIDLAETAEEVNSIFNAIVWPKPQ